MKSPTELSLREIQQLMAAVVMNPLTKDQNTRQKLQDGRATRDVANQIMKANDRLAGFDRIEIYNRQYWFRLIDCLYDDFPGLRAVIGEKKFYGLVLAYLEKYPSASYSLRNLGGRMEQFLTEEPSWLGSRSRAALEMVRFELAQVEAFDGPAWPALTPEFMAESDLISSRFHLQPYLTLLKLSYPFDEIMIAMRRAETQRSEAGATKAPAIGETEKLKLPKPASLYLAVHRVDNNLYYKRLEAAAFELLCLLKDGSLLGEACEHAAKQFSQRDLVSGRASKVIQEWFADWSALEWFCTPPDGSDLEDSLN